jgi:hypothetical protein
VHDQHCGDEQQQQQQQEQQQRDAATAGAVRVLEPAELAALARWCSNLLEAAAAQCSGTALDAIACSTLLYWMLQLNMGHREAVQYLHPTVGRRMVAAVSRILERGLAAADAAGAAVPAAVVVNMIYCGATLLGRLLPQQVQGGRPTASVVAEALQLTALRLTQRPHYQQQQKWMGQRLWEPAGRGSGWSWVSQLLWCEDFCRHKRQAEGFMGPSVAPQLRQELATACWTALQVRPS